MALSFSEDETINPNGLVYKFCPPEGIDYLLRAQTLRFSNLAKFNDCFELLGDFTDEAYRILFDAAGHFIPELHDPEIEHSTKEDLIANFLLKPESHFASLMANLLPSFLRQALTQRLGVLCVTKRPSNPVMWATYAREHCGIAVGFRPQSKIFTESVVGPLDLSGLTDVHYHTKRITNTSNDLVSGLTYSLLHKLDCWANEHEARCFRMLTADADHVDVPFASEDVVEILVGHRMDALHRERVHQVCKARYPNIRPLVAVPSADKAKLIMLVDICDWSSINAAQQSILRTIEETPIGREFKLLDLL